jgi:hypothetical protein
MRTCTALSLTALRRLASHSQTAFNCSISFLFLFFFTVIYRSWEQKWEGQRYFLYIMGYPSIPSDSFVASVYFTVYGG